MDFGSTLPKPLHVPQPFAFHFELDLLVHLNPGIVDLCQLKTVQFFLFLALLGLAL